MDIKFFFVIVFLSLNFVVTETNALELNCIDASVEGLCIDIEFVMTGKDFKTPSEYEFPDLVKINDHLVIKKITVINRPGIIAESKNTSSFWFRIDAYPMSIEREETAVLESTRYSYVYVPPLQTNDVFELIYLDNWGQYEARLNNQVIEGNYHVYPKKLFTDGGWKIDEEIEFDSIAGVGHSTIINGDWKNNYFKVYSNSEITNLEKTERSLFLSELGIGIIIVIAFMSVYYQSKLTRMQMKQNKELSDQMIEEQRKNFDEEMRERREYDLRKKKNMLESMLIGLKENLTIANELIDIEGEITKGEFDEELMNTFFTSGLEKVITEAIIEDETLNKQLISVLYLFNAINNTLTNILIPGTTKQKFMNSMGDTIDKLKEEKENIELIIGEAERYLEELD